MDILAAALLVLMFALPLEALLDNASTCIIKAIDWELARRERIPPACR